MADYGLYKALTRKDDFAQKRQDMQMQQQAAMQNAAIQNKILEENRLAQEEIERVFDELSSLPLENYDMNKIRSLMQSKKTEISESIKDSGGNLRTWRMRGGDAILRKYKRDILNSEEVANGKINKISAERARAAQDKGLVPLSDMYGTFAQMLTPEAIDENGGVIPYQGALPGPDQVMARAWSYISTNPDNKKGNVSADDLQDIIVAFDNRYLGTKFLEDMVSDYRSSGQSSLNWNYRAPRTDGSLTPQDIGLTDIFTSQTGLKGDRSFITGTQRTGRVDGKDIYSGIKVFDIESQQNPKIELDGLDIGVIPVEMFQGVEPEDNDAREFGVQEVILTPGKHAVVIPNPSGGAPFYVPYVDQKFDGFDDDNLLGDKSVPIVRGKLNLQNKVAINAVPNGREPVAGYLGYEFSGLGIVQAVHLNDENVTPSQLGLTTQKMIDNFIHKITLNTDGSYTYTERPELGDVFDQGTFQNTIYGRLQQGQKAFLINVASAPEAAGYTQTTKGQSVMSPTQGENQRNIMQQIYQYDQTGNRVNIFK